MCGYPWTTSSIKQGVVITQYILTFIDHVTHWAKAFPIRSQDAVTLAQFLLDQISQSGCPRQLLGDQRPCLEAALFKNLCCLLGIDKFRTTPYKPSTNGTVEWLHHTLNSMLGKVVSQNQCDLDLHLPHVMSAYRSTEHESTGYSPCRLFLGRENMLCYPLILCLEIVKLMLMCRILLMILYCKLRKSLLRLMLMLENLLSACQPPRYDLWVRPIKFKVGDWVYYYYPW